jgi:hypothetical protein
MASCCGAKSCACTVTAGPGITVDGNGSPTNPYIVSAGAAGQTALQATDTPTVDTTVSGTGTAADPFQVSAAVRLDPTPPGGGTNLVQAGPDGLFLECEQVRGCITAGDGITYDPATGEIAADISGDTGNTLTVGTDGGLMVPASTPGATTVVTAGDTPTVDNTVTGTGTAADPYVVSSAVRLDATPPGGGTNLVQAGPDGLFLECEQVRGCITAGDGITYDPATGEVAARVSTDAGNAATIGADGGIFAPAGGTSTPTVVEAGDGVTVTGTGTAADPYEVSALPLETGCGLTGAGSAADPVAAVVAAWPYAACDVDSYAGSVYCDSTGALRSEPRPVATYQQQQLDQVYPATLVPTGGGDTPVEDRPMTVVNPDPCREAFVIFEVEVNVEFTLPPNSAALYAIGGDDMWRTENKATQQVNDVHVQTTKVYNRIIPPGGTLVEPLVIGMGGNYNNNSTYHRIQSLHRAFIFNM